MVVKQILIRAVWGPRILVNEVTDVHSRCSLENDALKSKVTSFMHALILLNEDVILVANYLRNNH